MDNDDRRYLLTLIDAEWRRLDAARAPLNPTEQEFYIEKQTRLSLIADELRREIEQYD